MSSLEVKSRSCFRTLHRGSHDFSVVLAQEFETTLKEIVNAKRLSASKVTSLSETAMKCMQNDTQLVSILYRTHKSLSTASKVNSLYVFDAIARAARSQATKKNLSSKSETGNAATFLSKLESILDSLFEDMASISSSSAKVSDPSQTALTLDPYNPHYPRPRRFPYNIDSLPRTGALLHAIYSYFVPVV
jgi:hypothetical protein